MYYSSWAPPSFAYCSIWKLHILTLKVQWANLTAARTKIMTSKNYGKILEMLKSITPHYPRPTKWKSKWFNYQRNWLMIGIRYKPIMILRVIMNLPPNGFIWEKAAFTVTRLVIRYTSRKLTILCINTLMFMCSTLINTIYLVMSILSHWYTQPW